MFSSLAQNNWTHRIYKAPITPHFSLSIPDSPLHVHFTSSSSIDSPLSPSVTPTVFHSQLEIHLFHKSFPTDLDSLSSGLPPRNVTQVVPTKQICFSQFLVQCSRLNWPDVSFWVHINILNHTVWYWDYCMILSTCLLVCVQRNTANYCSSWWIMTGENVNQRSQNSNCETEKN